MTQYRLTFYVPEAQLDEVKRVVFKAGAGHVGQYDQCCWQTLGEGQFRPLSGSKPAIGVHDQVERLPEFKVELLCTEETVRQAVAALKAAHPYEEPAYEVYRLEDF